jgi:hypothetical protein
MKNSIGVTKTVAQNNQPTEGPQLVRAERLLELLFEKDSRPSLRWLRHMQSQRKIPYIKLGHLVRFDLEAVRSALLKNCTVRTKPLNVK